MLSPHLLRLNRPLITPLTLTFTLSSVFALHSTVRPLRPLLCDPPSPARNTYSSTAKVPVFQNGRPNPDAFRQLSAGSICGLVSGLAVSTFSKTLTVLFGLAVWGVQWLASRGYNPLPTDRLQRYLKGINLRSAIEDNAPFKFSFGITFMLAAFAEF